MPFTRYAVFVTPAPGPLADFCAAWLGWDAAEGVVRAHPDLGTLPRPVAAITATPRKYGFHGTVKPPFRLAEGSSEEGLRAALAALCTDAAPVDASRLEVAELGPFLALRPSGPVPDLDALAARVVADLDGFRAPPTEAELARRRAAGLSPSQEAHLTRWGYPFVMDDFHYHMTLTGPLPDDERGEVRAALAAHLAPLVPDPFPVTDLTLLGEGADGRFRHLARLPLAG